MPSSYDEWMASAESKKYFEVRGPKLSAGVRRILLTHWAWSAYLKLEQIRQKAEDEGRKSVFYRAFERSGCLITANGEDDAYIDVINARDRREGGGLQADDSCGGRDAGGGVSDSLGRRFGQCEQ